MTAAERGLTPDHGLDLQSARLLAWANGAPMHAEEQLLSVVIAFDAYFLASNVRSDHFISAANRSIWTACQHLALEGVTLAPQTVWDKLEGLSLASKIDFGYLSGLPLQAPASDLASHFADRVIAHHVAREFTAAAGEIRRLALEAAGSVDLLPAAIAGAQTALSTLTVDQSRGPVSPQFIASQIAEQFHVASETDDVPIPGMSLGFPDLDRMTGGSEEGDLIIIGGRPSMGKTSLAMAIAEFVSGARDLMELGDEAPLPAGRVVVFSMEMAARQLAERSIASLATVDLMSVRSRAFGDPRQCSDAQRAAAAVSRAALKIDDQPRRRLGTLLSSMAREMALSPVALFIFDHKDYILRDDPRDPQLHDEVLWTAYIVATLKEWAKKLGSRCILINQLTRTNEGRADKKPVMSDLRGGGYIEQDADLILFPYRPFVYDKTQQPSAATLIVAKARSGATGEVPLRWVPKSASYRSISETDRFAIRDEASARRPSADDLLGTWGTTGVGA